MNKILSLLLLAAVLQSCTEDKGTYDKKGFQVNEISENEEGEKVVGLPLDSIQIETQPGNVLLTTNAQHRLTPLYKVNYNKKTKQPFTGSNDFHRNWDDYEKGNNWNNNLMPGFSAMYGFNLVNISHFDNVQKTQNQFFDKAVLIKTLYYPTFSKDTLNYKPVQRNYYMTSVYDEDTNKDGFVNFKDLRRFYLFDSNGKFQKALIPKNYSVMSSEYDSDNDYMYIYAKLDQNQNGKLELNEPTHIFWIDLKNPDNNGIQYKN
jgi:hypothetical protein